MTTLKKVFISSSNNSKAIAFFEEINKRKEEARKRFDERTAKIREKITRNTASVR